MDRITSPVTGAPYFPIRRDDLECLNPLELARHAEGANLLGVVGREVLRACSEIAREQEAAIDFTSTGDSAPERLDWSLLATSLALDVAILDAEFKSREGR